ncbi:S41 family peptidase [Crassaminicella profunda]|uniref:S41 family peptidase n=1 Tax=Crassaminicella profunda TaxID=1286698 RepID=UPI001CA61F89|nr:S41 family peptidase [Crassaminicella profunda]QZY55849.1 tetratricopeptide repeat protein [Crassaminicella profunda]
MKLKKMMIISFCILYTLLLTSCGDATQEENSKAYEYNDKGLALMDEEKVEEAIEYFNKSLNCFEWYDKDFEKLTKNLKKEKEVFDAPLNNLSWAYTELGEYEKSLEYIELALLVLPNDEEEYINKADALFELSRYEEAFKNYDEALKKNCDSIYAHFGKGKIYFENEKYKEALEEFNQYLESEKDDFEIAKYKIYCHLYLNEEEKALNYANKLINENKDNYDACKVKGLVLKLTSDYETIKSFYEEAAKKFPEHLDAQIDLGRFYYKDEHYNKSLDYFTKLIKKYPKNVDLYTWVIYNYSALNQYDKALEYGEKALKINKDSSTLYNAIGNVYIDKTAYMESIKYFDEAIKLDPNYENAYINKLYALYTGKRYSKCIEFGKASEVKFQSVYNIPWFMGESYLELDQCHEAIKEYKKSLDLKPDNDEILSSIAYAYLILEDYENAKVYVEKSLKINSENSEALHIKDLLEKKQETIGKQIKTFFSDNYLYKEQSQDLDKKLSTYLDKNNISGREIAQVISKVKIPDDIFTFVIAGKDYDSFIESEEDDIAYKSYDKDLCYMRIKNFSSNTGNRAIEILDKIKDTKNKTLIIDLRENYGGDTKSANDILDALLPKCVTSTLIFRDGYNYNYYSDASQVSFKKIYILVNENSASASELLTLGLKTYLKNVIIIGRNTFGKGVGQHVFEDKKRKIMVFVVSHYWNVRETNIMQKYVKPDVYIERNDLKDFLNVIKER